ncbi:MAG TPA: hypothetical protein PKL31_07760 [Fulvivirga sp.]|nr:hypothetical protein [Fulvivirga sp.]
MTLIYWWEHFFPSFFEAKKRSKKALKKYRTTSNAQIANPAAPSHTTTPFFRLARLGEGTFSKNYERDRSPTTTNE